MTFMRRPRVFISYRHEERRGWLGARRYAERHRAWVGAFVEALGSWNVDVVWDERLRKMFASHTRSDPSLIPFMAELSTLCLQVTQTFMPILTRGYIERIEGASGGAGYGTVSEEWRNGIEAHAAGRAEVIAIVREWPIPGCTRPPAPIVPDKAWDYRFVEPTGNEAELLGDVLQGLWSVERPQFDMAFGDWIRLYTEHCVKELRLPWPDLEHWGCDFDRPRRFIQRMEEQAADRAADPEAGSHRDMAEAFPRHGIPTVRVEKRAVDPGNDDPAWAQQTDEAIEMVRSVMTAHAKEFGRPFDFSQRAPGRRASRGLYFGRTLPGFSFLHPKDPDHPG